MSLDISLVPPPAPCCTTCGKQLDDDYLESWDSNTTNNLYHMANESGMGCIWDPEKFHVKTASDLVGPLTNGVAELLARPGYYRRFSAANGWGTYEQFVPWVQGLLEACKNYPHYTVKVSR